MNFYHILFALKQGFNRNLTWYENLFVRFYNNTIAKLVAKILRIKGNTVSFNQQLSQENIGSQLFRATVSKNNNVITITENRTSANTSFGCASSIPTFAAGNKLYAKLTLSSINVSGYRDITFYLRDNLSYTQCCTPQIVSSTGVLGFVFEATRSGDQFAFNVTNTSAKTGTTDNVVMQNMMVFNLTLMGIDNLTTVAEVEEWLSSHIGDLPYFDYTQGTLIPFMGSGLKTTGINLFDKNARATSSYISSSNGNVISSGSAFSASDFIRVFGGQGYYLKDNGFSGNNTGAFYDGNKQFISGFTWVGAVSIPANACYIRFTLLEANIDITMFSKGTSALDYEAYWSNTLSLPILTYFPTGMKSAGSVYDELTSSKAITRIGSRAYQSGDESDPTVITDGTITYYPLPTPTETDISLDLTYPIQWGGTEQILPVNTSTPTTSGIVADIKYPDGIRYDQTFVYRVIEKATQLGNRALSIMLGKKVETDNPEEPLDILLKGEK